MTPGPQVAVDPDTWSGQLAQLCDPSGYISLDRLLALGTDVLRDSEAQVHVEDQLRALDTEGTGLIAFDVFCRAVSAILNTDSSEVDLENPVKSSSTEEVLSRRSSARSRSTRPRSSMLSTEPSAAVNPSTPTFIVTSSTPATQQDDGSAVVCSLADMDSTLEITSPSLKTSNRNNSSSSQCSSLSDGENYECLGEGTPTTAVSPVPGNKGESPGGQHLHRNTWSRSSLRRTPQSKTNSSPGDHLSRRWGSFRQSNKRVAGSNAPPSPLYRSASFNSSGRSSNCGDADDMYCSDASLEEDVMGLNRKVHMLQQQVSALADTQNNTDDRYGRARQENALLQARVMILEEQLREEQVRAEERLQEEQRRHRDLVARVDREKQLELENSAIRLQAVERKASSLEEEVTRLRSQSERQAASRLRAEETIAELEAQLHSLRSEHAELEESNRRQQSTAQQDKLSSAQLLEELRHEVETLRARQLVASSSASGGQRGAELEAEVRALREESKGLRETLEEAQAQLLSQGLEQGRTLLGEGTASLADELEEMSADKLDAGSGAHLEQVRVALREQQEVNLQLRSYIDGILLNIVENYPQLLEVKTKKTL